jgi:hypothetical protein
MMDNSFLFRDNRQSVYAHFVMCLITETFFACICSLWLAAIAELFLFLCSISDLAAYGPLAIRSCVTWAGSNNAALAAWLACGLPCGGRLGWPLASTTLFAVAALPMHHNRGGVVATYGLGYTPLR